MLALHGAGVSDGIRIGRAFVLQRETPEVDNYVLLDAQIEDEVERFTRAIAAARAQLLAIRDHIPSDVPPEAASFIDTHVMILDDRMISHEPIELIRRQSRNAEWALRVQRDQLGQMFERMKDPYLRNKKVDINQVVDRVLRQLSCQDSNEVEVLDAGDIVVANDLTPADTVLLKHRRVHAFVTDFGGPISHTAILARSLGIPAIVSVHGATRYVRNGENLIVDGRRGIVIVAPDENTIAEYRRRIQNIASHRKALQKLRLSPAVTLDRHRITLLANIELPADVNAAVAARAAGIGLYRTEFLYMNRVEPPSEEEQFRAYARVVRALPGKQVTIRTFDLGADKQVDGARAQAIVAINPALGLRAVRLCLSDPALFKPQLRAILRASALGRVRLMIPMLSSQDEMFRVLDLIQEVKSDLKRARQSFNRHMPVGGMIEVPAAALSADLFAPYLDFFSIGTNDLIQYTLAIDRVDDAVNYLYDPLHPAVIRLIAVTIQAGRKANIPVAMCGEMAGDPRYTRLLMGLGLREFSMHPATLLPVKRIVRESDFGQLARRVRQVLTASDGRAVHDLVDKLNGTEASYPAARDSRQRRVTQRRPAGGRGGPTTSNVGGM